MANEIDERFAFITLEDGRKFQALKLDEDGQPVDWDEEATSELVRKNATIAI